jgi:hypothetical protein
MSKGNKPPKNDKANKKPKKAVAKATVSSETFNKVSDLSSHRL